MEHLMAIRMRRLMPVVPGREAWEERGMAPQGTRRGRLPLHSPRYPIFHPDGDDSENDQGNDEEYDGKWRIMMIQFSFQGFLIVMLNEGIIKNKI